MNTPIRHLLPVIQPGAAAGGGCGCGADTGLEQVTRLAATPPACPPGLEPDRDPHLSGFRQLLERQVDRRTAMGSITAGLLAGLGLVQTACNPVGSAEAREQAVLEWQEFFQSTSA